MAQIHTPHEEQAASLWSDVPEHELVRLAKSGDGSAFEQLVSATSDVCLRMATCILGSTEDARDEVQNAYWLAYSRIELFTRRAKFSTWLVRIVINRCLMRLRSEQRTPILPNHITARNGAHYSCEGVTRATPELDLGKREVMQALRRELRHVPPLLRRPIEMHYISELPVKDVASALGLSEAATKSRLHRGHLYLRDRMLKHAARRGPASLIAR
ncbi:MAG: sigma-70 family RNA polymerase sigma factor [Acidobacteriaceae bacterium]|nr:sigma-70 family RNA polymerase sigma factor [Acidobacteriaceae bacterium]